MSIEEQREELQRVLHAAQFRRAPKLQKFLSLICEYHFENRSSEISEFLIASEAYGKGTDFDPSQDSIVRVQAREARRRLREYYQGEGKQSRLVLEIPIGSYIPTFTAAGLSRAGRRALSFAALWPKLSVAALVAIAILLFLDFRRNALRNSSPAAADAAGLPPAVARLWNRFLNADAPSVLVLSNPVVSDCTTEEIAAAAARGTPGGAQEACPDEYTGMGEAVALYLVTNVFRAAKSKLTVKQSRMLSAEEVRRSNLILLGGKLVNPWTKAFGPELSLGGENNEPPAALSGAEAERYQTVFDRRTGKLIRDRGLMALRRHPATGHWLLFLYGAHSQGTHAAAEAAIDERFLSQLKWPGRPFPDRFEVFVSVNVKDGGQNEVLPVATRVP
jgi:hypothetical protein